MDSNLFSNAQAHEGSFTPGTNSILLTSTSPKIKKRRSMRIMLNLSWKRVNHLAQTMRGITWTSIPTALTSIHANKSLNVIRIGGFDLMANWIDKTHEHRDFLFIVEKEI